MDEYERAERELETVLHAMTTEEYDAIVEPQARPELQSVHAMMEHVVNACYGYAVYTAGALGAPRERPRVHDVPHGEAIAMLRTALAFTDDVLRPHYTMSEDDMDQIHMTAPWKIEYSIDQMLEHAVCHILRHRRQIEKFVATQRGIRR